MRVHVWGRDWKLGSLSPGWTEWSETVLNRFRHSVKLDGKKERREQSSSYLRLQHSRCPAPTHRGQRRNREAGQVNSGKTVSVQQLSFTFQSEGHHDVTPRNTSNQHGDTFTPIHPRFVRWHVPKYMYKYDGKWRKKKVFLFLYVVFPPMVSGRLFFFAKISFFQMFCQIWFFLTLTLLWKEVKKSSNNNGECLQMQANFFSLSVCGDTAIDFLFFFTPSQKAESILHRIFTLISPWMQHWIKNICLLPLHLTFTTQNYQTVWRRKCWALDLLICIKFTVYFQK